MTDASPLQQIEAKVLDAAKTLDLDPRAPAAASRLRDLISDQLDRWEDEVRRGRRAVALADAEELADRAYRNLAGYGPLEPLLDDDDVWEIMINAPDSAFR